MSVSPSYRNRLWLGALASVVAVVAFVWLLPPDLYLSSHRWDLGEFVALRSQVADSIKAGHFPLWNPYIYSGEPLLGDFQSGELYPLNVIFLFMPLVRAINLSFLLHLLITGWGVGVWAGRRGYHPTAAALAGFAAALSGPVVLRLANGQLAYLIGAAWAPWILCGLEAAWRGPARKPLLLTMAAISLQITGGHPQYVFYVAIAAGLHAVVQTVADPAVRRRALPLLMLAYVGGGVLAAAQLLPGLAALAEGLRQGRLDYEFVRLSAFPPENLITLIAPAFFGNFTTLEYWGRYFYWEMCLFFSVAGLVLALLALGDREYRRTVRMDWLLAGIFFLLALGDHTPLLRVLYDHAPYFDKFRSLSKFTFPAMLFGVMALAAGADAVIRGRLGSKFFAISVAIAGLVAGGLGGYFWGHPECLGGILEFERTTGENSVLPLLFADQNFSHTVGVQAGKSLAMGGLLLTVIGGALLLARRYDKWRWVPLALLPIEMVCFARTNILTTKPDALVYPDIRNFIAAHPGDYRIINASGPNNSYLLGAADLWGDNPSALKRYAEFMALLKGDDPDHATQLEYSFELKPLHALLRLRYLFRVQDNQDLVAMECQNALPQALLDTDYQVWPGRDAIFAAMSKPDFDPRKTVLLESEPAIRPQPAAQPGTVKVTTVNSDALIIEADTPTPAILLITDVYSRDWYARALEGSSQTHYEIQPGDYILRAIPLAAGHHHLAVEFVPPSFRLGLGLSGLSLVGWVGCWFWPRRRRPAA